MTNHNCFVLLQKYEIASLLFTVQEQLTVCRDPKDDKFLSLAVSAKASAIVSGDDDLLVLHPFRNIPIVSPAGFLDLY